MSWQPRKEGIEQIVNVLQNCQDPRQEIQAEVIKAYENFKTIPEYAKYLTYILVHLQNQVTPEVRFQAGMWLKSQILCFPESSDLQYVKEEIVKIINESNPMMRRSTAILLTTILNTNGLGNWPGIIEYLASCLENQDENLLEGAFLSLSFICEDHGVALEKNSSRPLDVLLPKFLTLFNHNNKSIRLLAIESISRLIPLQPKCLVDNINNFMAGFFYLAQFDDNDTKVMLIGVFMRLCDTRRSIEMVEFFLPQIVQFMIACNSSTSKEVALFSLEFWRLLSEYDQMAVDAVSPYLQPLITVLLSNLKYSPEELKDIGTISEDAHIPDNISSYNTVYGIGQQPDPDDNEDYSGWNTRRCSIQALDYISRPFNKGFFEVFMPLVQSGLQSTDWIVLESSLLALGCISIGQYHAIKPSLSSLIQYLFDLTSHENPLIRSCCCWVLSRYNKWILYHRDENTNFFHKLLEILLTRVKDKNKEVQRAAVVALADICDESFDHIIPYSETILLIFCDAFTYFQKKNLLLLMRSIGAVARAMGSSFANAKHVDVIVPPLLKCWNEVDDDSPEIFPIFDCFLSMSRAMGKQFAPYAAPIFQRSLKLIDTYLKDLDDAMRTNDEPPDNSFAILPIDMLSGLLRSLGSDIGILIDNSNYMNLFVELLKNVDYAVDQSKFALVGDMARFVPDKLFPLVNNLFPILIAGTNTMCQYIDTTHNALWAIGEIVVAYSKEKNQQNPPEFLSPYLEDTLKRVFYILSSPEADDLTETAAVLLGRIAWACPRILIESQYQLKEILKPFCISLRNLGDGLEKTEGLKGFMCVVQTKTDLVMGQADLAMVLDLLLNWHGRDEELINTIGTFMHFIKTHLGQQQWDGVISVFPNYIKTRIVDFYKC